MDNPKISQIIDFNRGGIQHVVLTEDGCAYEISGFYAGKKSKGIVLRELDFKFENFLDSEDFSNPIIKHL